MPADPTAIPPGDGTARRTERRRCPVCGFWLDRHTVPCVPAAAPRSQGAARETPTWHPRPQANQLTAALTSPDALAGETPLASFRDRVAESVAEGERIVTARAPGHTDLMVTPESIAALDVGETPGDEDAARLHPDTQGYIDALEARFAASERQCDDLIDRLAAAESSAAAHEAELRRVADECGMPDAWPSAAELVRGKLMHYDELLAIRAERDILARALREIDEAQPRVRGMALRAIAGDALARGGAARSALGAFVRRRLDETAPHVRSDNSAVIAALTAERDALLNVKRWAAHGFTCGVRNGFPTCSCGLYDALAALGSPASEVRDG